MADDGSSTLTVTFFGDKAALIKDERCLSLAELAGFIRDTSRGDKKKLPWLKPARFGDVRTDHGSLRHDDNVLAITGIAVDYDGEKVSLDEGVETLTKAGISSLAYTSPSHTENAPRWRVLCPLSRELPPDQHERLVSRLNGVLGGLLTRESWTLSQAYYFGSVANNPSHDVRIVPGTSIDLRAELDANAVGRPERPKLERPKGQTAEPGQPRTEPPQGGTAYGRAALQRECDAVRGAPDGSKHDILNKAAFAIGGLVGAGELREDEARADLMAALAEIASRCDDVRAAERTVQDGLRDGMALPRTRSNGNGAAHPHATNRNGRTASNGSGKTDKPTKEPPTHERVIDALITAGVTFFRDPLGGAYATVPCDPANPNAPVARYPVDDGEFVTRVRLLYGDAYPVHGPRGARPGAFSKKTTVLPHLEAMALRGPVYDPGVRVAGSREDVWIDLGDATFRAIRVTAEGWTVADRAPAQFPLIRRSGSMAPLPLPRPDPDAMQRYRRLLNLGDDPGAAGRFRLVVMFQVSVLYPFGPYCIVAVGGPPGAAKTTGCRMLRDTADPQAVPLRAPPRGEEDLVIAARHNRVLAWDNMGDMKPNMADMFCRLATGTACGKRRLWTNADEHLVAAERPVILNGISPLLVRGDLADRGIVISLPEIPDDARRPREEMQQAFAEVAPGVLAALLDGLVTALRRLPTLKLARLPRMADFARLACAAAPAFGWTEDDILAELDANRAEAGRGVIEDDPVAQAVQDFAEARTAPWKGTATELLACLRFVPEAVQRERTWPKDGARLSRHLNRIMAALRTAGIDVRGTREGNAGQRTITITCGAPEVLGETTDELPSAASAAAKAAENHGFSADASQAHLASAPPNTPAGAPPNTPADASGGAVASAKKGWKPAASEGADGADGNFAQVSPHPIIVPGSVRMSASSRGPNGVPLFGGEL
jgi:hypothetical protein